jgi:hypothetical protein
MTRKPIPNILDDILSADPGKTTPICVREIKTDGGTQMRAGLDDGTVSEYADSFREQRAWGSFPAVLVYHDGTDYWLADGFHRVAAWKRSGNSALGLETIPADVRVGTRRDAILHAAGANASHGLRRTNADKRRAVEMLLRDEEWAKWSNSEIARRCAVGETTVRNIRAELETTSQIAKSPERIGADGRTINTANIGANRPAPPDMPAQRRYESALPALDMPAPGAPPRYKSLAQMVDDGDIPAARSRHPAVETQHLASLLPITEFELTDICETVATEVYGDDLQFLRTYYAMMSSIDRQEGIYQEKLLRVLAPFDLTPQRIKQAVHTQAKQMVVERRLTKAQAQEAASERPQQKSEAVAAIEETADAETMPTEAQDIRIGQCSRLINVYRQAIAAEQEYGQLTGCFTEPLAAKRELEKLIIRLQRTLDLLEGRDAEPMEACD